MDYWYLNLIADYVFYFEKYLKDKSHLAKYAISKYLPSSYKIFAYKLPWVKKGRYVQTSYFARSRLPENEKIFHANDYLFL